MMLNKVKLSFIIMLTILLVSCTSIKQEKLQENIVKVKANEANIALLLPLSGASASIGKAMSDAAKLAKSDDSKIILHVFDTDKPDYIADLNKQIDKIDLIVGPLFAKDSLELRQKINNNIPIISFTSDIRVAQNNLYILGVSPKQQVERIITYATLHDIDDLYAILPNNFYGKIVYAELEKLAKVKNIPVMKTEFYTDKQEDIIAKTDNILKAMAAHAYMGNNIGKTRGLLIADGGNTLKTITAAIELADADLTKIRLLGIGTWDNAEVFNNEILEDSWFASGNKENFHDFSQLFMQQYHYNPPRVASLAYDAILLVKRLVMDREISAKELTDNAGFKGVDGIFRFKENGINERGLSIISIQNKQAVTISASPEQFDN
jgi:branched-chain amino acid transport system substrate-binding protein